MDRKEQVITPSIKVNNEKMHILAATKNEDCIKSSVKAAGWMDKHVLWNKPTLQASVADINNKYENPKMK